MRRAPSFALVCGAILLAASAACGGGDEPPAEDPAGGAITSPLAAAAGGATDAPAVEGTTTPLPVATATPATAVTATPAPSATQTATARQPTPTPTPMPTATPTPTATPPPPFTLTSVAFAEGQPIPSRYTCMGEDISPPLDLGGVPDETAALALVMDHPDFAWVHWVAFNLPVVETIAEDVGSVGTGGHNSRGNTRYFGPCPPPGTSRYFFRLYALDAALDLDEGADKLQVLSAIKGHVLAEATLMGTFSRQ